MTTEKSAIVVRGWQGQPTPAELAARAEKGDLPRTPYVELARVLDADVIDNEFLAREAHRLSRRVGRTFGVVEGQVLEAFLRRERYRHIVAFADRIGLELAMLLKLTRSRRDLVLISNWLMGESKRAFFDRGRVQSHLGTIIGFGSVQLDLTAQRYGFPRERMHLALQPVDERFWQPADEPAEPDLICSVGCVSGFRDYRTLIAAARDLPVRVELAVGSLILSASHRRERAQLFQTTIPPDELPENVEYKLDLPLLELRDLYARSRFVVMPLEDVDFDAGVTSITEAMAMGKAVIVTRNRGQVDVIRDGVEGIYVPPRDPRALREAIQHLLDSPEEAARMGAAGRDAVLQRHTLDGYVERVSELVRASGEVDVAGLPADRQPSDQFAPG
jgi:glycosyltransferase involved in cell wall biosynthesis